jgi:hypothetical protein
MSVKFDVPGDLARALWRLYGAQDDLVDAVDGLNPESASIPGPPTGANRCRSCASSRRS